MTIARVLLIGSLLWALLFIGSAWVFRGNDAKPWVEGVLYVVWTAWFGYASTRGRCARA